MGSVTQSIDLEKAVQAVANKRLAGPDMIPDPDDRFRREGLGKPPRRGAMNMRDQFAYNLGIEAALDALWQLGGLP